MSLAASSETQERRITDAVMLREYADAARDRKDVVGIAVLEKLARIYEDGNPYALPHAGTRR